MTVLHDGTPEAAGMDSRRIELIRQRGGEWVDAGNSQALVLLVARHGVVCLHEAWGTLTGAADSTPTQPDSLFLLASLAKPVTTVAAMMLVEDGRLGLTRPVDYYIPEFCGEGSDQMLVQHLLTHTSGIDDEQGQEYVARRIAEGFDQPKCPPNQHPGMHERLHALYPITPSKPPGAEMIYAQQNFELLGEIIRRITGEAFTDFVDAQIFEPLGMTDSTFGFDAAFEPRLALDLEHPNLPLLPAGDEGRAVLAVPNASGALYAPIGDYARFAQMLLNRGRYGEVELLRPGTVDQMIRNQIPGIGVDFWASGRHAEASWGYGLDVTCVDRWRWWDGNLKPDGCFGHSGAGGTFFWVDPHNDLIALYFSTCLDMDPETLEHHWNIDLFQNLVTAAVAD